mgnify:CR=1 FL=1
MSNEYTKPLPKITALTKPFWDHAKAGRVAVQLCRDCGDVRFPPSPVCPRCLSDNQGWRVTQGRGTLESWVEFHRAYWGGFAEDLPYPVALVRLYEGLLLVSALVGPREGARLGAEVRAVFEPVTDEITLPKFELTGE